MNSLLLLFMVVVLIGFLGALAFLRQSLVARILSSIVALAVAGFGVFGFLATFEPSEAPALPWRVGYGILVTGSLLALVPTLKNRRQPK